jgi:hypothetical protein
MDIQPQMQKQLKSLVAALDAAVPTFVLIDPLGGEPVPLELASEAQQHNPIALTRARNIAWARETFPVVLPKTITLATHQHPYLVALQNPTDAWLEQTLETAFEETEQAQQNGLEGTGLAAHRIGGWLQSCLGPEILAQQLARMMCVNTEAFTQARYQRLGDRRTLGWLRCIVGDTRLCAPLGGAMGGIQRWSYLDAGGHIAQLHSTGQEASDNLRLARAEWTRFMLGEQLHPALARWMGEQAAATPQVSTLDAHTLYTRAAAALQQADAAAQSHPQRFDQPQDRVAWAALTLAYPGIEQDPAVRRQLDAKAVADEPLDTIHTLCTALRDTYTANTKKSS